MIRIIRKEMSTGRKIVIKDMNGVVLKSVRFVRDTLEEIIEAENKLIAEVKASQGVA